MAFLLIWYTHWYTNQVYDQSILFKNNNLTEIMMGVSHPRTPVGYFGKYERGAGFVDWHFGAKVASVAMEPLERTPQMTTIACFGTGFQRGLAHGETARAEVRAALARWEEASLAGLPDVPSIKDYAQRFLAETGLWETAQHLCPDLADEVRGIAQGADLPEVVVVAYNLMDEQWWYDFDSTQSPPEAEPGCSLMALRGPGDTVIAQNMDLPAFMDGSQVILHLGGPDMPETLLLSAAGLIGLTGMNRAGVAICVNTLLMLRHQKRGLPVAFMLRRALAERTAESALGVLRALPHASGQHYAVADKGGVTGLECSALGAAVSSQGQCRLLHTNHPLASADTDSRALAMLTARGRIADSTNRLAHMAALGPQGAEGVKAMLTDPAAPLCMVADSASRSQTFGSVLFELGDSPQGQIRLGLPGRDAWQSLAFTT